MGPKLYQTSSHPVARRSSRIGVTAAIGAPILRKRRARLPDWGIPVTYSLLAVVLGAALPRIESRWLPDLLAPLSAAVAIAIDSSVASGMIALTGIVFALTFLMVQFGALAYSPRLVSWMARDPVLMHAIGVFTATFLYALSALAWVDRLGSGHVPFLSTSFVILLLLASVALFIGLVKRVRQLQIQSVLIFTSEQGRRVIDGLYPPLDAPTSEVRGELDTLPSTQVLIHHGRPRTIQALDASALVAASRDSGGIIEVVSAVGDTLGDGMVLLHVYGARQAIDDRRLIKAFVLGDERTFEQDPKYAIRILVDIAIRALSPAVNDPATAVQALDQIEDLLLRLGRRRFEIGACRDLNGDLRLVLPCPAWEDFLMLALEEIRHYGASSQQVMRRMGALLSDLIDVLPEERRPALRREEQRLKAVIARSFADDDEILLASIPDRQGIGGPRRHGVEG